MSVGQSSWLCPISLEQRDSSVSGRRRCFAPDDWHSCHLGQVESGRAKMGVSIEADDLRPVSHLLDLLFTSTSSSPEYGTKRTIDIGKH